MVVIRPESAHSGQKVTQLTKFRRKIPDPAARFEKWPRPAPIFDGQTVEYF